MKVTSEPSLTSVAPKPWKAVFLVVAVFLLGLSLGVGGTLLVLRGIVSRQMAMTKIPEAAPIDRLLNRVADQLSDEFEMDEAGRAAMQREMELTARQLKELRLSSTLQMRKLTSETLVRLEQQVPEKRRERFRERAVARLAPWGLLPQTGDVEAKETGS